MKRLVMSFARLSRGSHVASAVRLCCQMLVPRRAQRIRPFVGFLAMLVAAGLLFSAGTAQAEIISINIGPSGFNIGGSNGGVPYDDFAVLSNFPISDNTLALYNNLGLNRITGLLGVPTGTNLMFANEGSPASPHKFSRNDSIGSTYQDWTAGQESYFRISSSVSPNFGSGSYMGFLTSQGNYGWLEVTWTASSDQFQILSGAYESSPNTAILAGAVAVPEPSTYAMLATGLAALGLVSRRRSRS